MNPGKSLDQKRALQKPKGCIVPSNEPEMLSTGVSCNTPLENPGILITLKMQSSNSKP